MFRALYLEQNTDKSTAASLRELDDSALPAFEARGVTIDIAHSTINYKDGLAISGSRRLCASGRWCPESTSPAP